MELEVERPNLTDYQKDFLYNEARFTIVESSTKAGKTFACLWWLFENAMKSEKNGSNYWWVAPVYQQAKIAFERLRRVIQGSPSFQVNISDLTVKCPSGAVIHFKSGEKPDNLYGEDVYAAIFDEASRAREESWFALRSTLTKTRGQVKLIGNSKGKKNWLYKLGAKARAGEPNYAYFKITAWDAVEAGILEREEVEQAQRDLPEQVFKELYLAEPQEDGSNPFGYEHIADCIKPLSGKPSEFFGIDLAKSKDWTVIIGLDGECNISHFERFQKDWKQTRERIIEVVGLKRAMIDATGVGDPIVEDISRECPYAEGFKYTSQSKQQLIEGLALAIQRGEIGLIDGILKDELEAFEFTYKGGNVKYEAPQGFTDDCVNALALANRIKQFKGGTEIRKPKKFGLSWRDAM
jgi:phage FluMu gp28-like protein